MMEEPKRLGERPMAFPGYAVLGCYVVGIAGLIAFLSGIIDHKDVTGAGVCLIASALSFGLLANAVFRQ